MFAYVIRKDQVRAWLTNRTLWLHSFRFVNRNANCQGHLLIRVQLYEQSPIFNGFSVN